MPTVEPWPWVGMGDCLAFNWLLEPTNQVNYWTYIYYVGNKKTSDFQLFEAMKFYIDNQISPFMFHHPVWW